MHMNLEFEDGRLEDSDVQTIRYPFQQLGTLGMHVT